MAGDDTKAQELLQLDEEWNYVQDTIRKSVEGRRLLEEDMCALLRVGDQSIILSNSNTTIDSDDKSLPVDLEILFDHQTWHDILDNKLTPTDAWFKRGLQVLNLGTHKSAAVWFLSLMRIYQGRYFWREYKDPEIKP
jgi:hypothetical protein